jgi:hypothetical protein
VLGILILPFGIASWSRADNVVLFAGFFSILFVTVKLTIDVGKA